MCIIRSGFGNVSLEERGWYSTPGVKQSNPGIRISVRIEFSVGFFFLSSAREYGSPLSLGLDVRFVALVCLTTGERFPRD